MNVAMLGILRCFNPIFAGRSPGPGAPRWRDLVTPRCPSGVVLLIQPEYHLRVSRVILITICRFYPSCEFFD